MHRVHEQHGLVVAHGIQQIFVGGDLRLLRFLVQPARDHFGLAIFQPQPMQQRNHPRAAFVDEAEFLGDPRADVTRRARKRRVRPSFQGYGLLRVHQAGTAAHVEGGQAFDAALLEQSMPFADRVVVEQQNPSHFLAAHPIIQEDQGVRASGHPADPRAVTCERDQSLSILFAEKAATNHAAIRIRPAPRCKRFLPVSQRVGVYPTATSYATILSPNSA
jgi:hypothetical protein